MTEAVDTEVTSVSPSKSAPKAPAKKAVTNGATKPAGPGRGKKPLILKGGKTLKEARDAANDVMRGAKDVLRDARTAARTTKSALSLANRTLAREEKALAKAEAALAKSPKDKALREAAKGAKATVRDAARDAKATEREHAKAEKAVEKALANVAKAEAGRLKVEELKLEAEAKAAAA